MRQAAGVRFRIRLSVALGRLRLDGFGRRIGKGLPAEWRKSLTAPARQDVRESVVASAFEFPRHTPAFARRINKKIDSCRFGRYKECPEEER